MHLIKILEFDRLRIPDPAADDEMQLLFGHARWFPGKRESAPIVSLRGARKRASP